MGIVGGKIDQQGKEATRKFETPKKMLRDLSLWLRKKTRKRCADRGVLGKKSPEKDFRNPNYTKGQNRRRTSKQIAFLHFREKSKRARRGTSKNRTGSSGDDFRDNKANKSKADSRE